MAKTLNAKKRFPTAMAERNLVVVALVGLTILTMIFFVTFRANSLPIIGGGKTYTATFAEAGGLKKGNETRIAGIKVGEVTDLKLKGKTVEVKFRVKGVDLGDQTTAAVKVKTMLGQKYLSLDPRGRKPLTASIPLDHTTTPYDVNAAFSDLASNIGEIDTKKMEKSFEVLSDAFKDTPDNVQAMVAGLTDLSRTVSSRDDELAGLLESTKNVSGTLKGRNAEFAKLITDGSSLLGELEKRREAVHKMLTSTSKLSVQLTGLVHDNEKQLKPALAKLDQVSAILSRNQDNLDAALKKLGPYYRVLASALGNGRWVDSYICGLFDASSNPVLENDVERNCKPAKGGGK